MSPAHALLRAVLATCDGDLRIAHVALERMFAGCVATELAALFYDWSFWARPAQRIPAGTWRSRGAMCGRGAGKTRSCVSYVIDEIAAGRARRVALVGPTETATEEVLVHGETGLLALAPFWMGADYKNGSVRFGNGAICTVHHATSPDSLRGPQFDLLVCTEVSSWPRSTGSETMANVRHVLRLGAARLLWDSTPRRRCPLIRALLARHTAEPTKHLLWTEHSRENAINLAEGVVAEWERDLAGTSRGREELAGEYLDEADDQLFMQSWIDASRRPMPARYDRKIISVDPASTSNKRSDSTGIVVLGAADKQLFVIANLSRKERIAEWARRIVDYYVDNACDLVLAETNRGQDFVEEALAAACERRGGIVLRVAPEGITPRSSPGILNYKPYTARGSKSERATAAASLIEHGQVSFLPGALGDLEERLVFFDGADGKPDDCVDALVGGIRELADLTAKTVDPRIAFRGIGALSDLVSGAHPRRPRETRPTNIAALIAGFGSSGGGRI